MDTVAMNLMSTIQVMYGSWVAYINQWLTYLGAGSPALSSIIGLLSLWMLSGILWWCCLVATSRYHYNH